MAGGVVAFSGKYFSRYSSFVAVAMVLGLSGNVRSQVPAETYQGSNSSFPQMSVPAPAGGGIPSIVGNDRPLPGEATAIGRDPRDPRLEDPSRASRRLNPADLKGLDTTDFRLYARQDAVEATEFQEFVFQSTGRLLKIFGQDLFEGATRSTFEPLDRVPVTPDYLVGPGDELMIRGWGQVNIDYRAIVERDGSINIRGVGAVSVGGVAFRDLERVLRRAIGKVYQNFELSVTMRSTLNYDGPRRFS